MTKKRWLLLAAYFMAITTIRAPVSIHAEETTVFPANEKGNLTIKYFDDEDNKIPVSGSEFKVYQVSTIGRQGEENGKYLPLIPSIDFTNQTSNSATQYEKTVTDAYKTNPQLGFTTTVTTSKDGLAKITDMPVGAYLVCETRASRYHIKTVPFLVSVPEMNDRSNAWNFDVTTEPKANIAGDLTVKKHVTGTFPTNKSNTFSFRIRVAEGEYKAVDGNGHQIKVKDGTILQLKDGQQFTIYDLPEESDYRITEVEANKNGYSTKYKNRVGQIRGKNETLVTVTNHRDLKNVGTGIFFNPNMLLIFIGASATLIVFILLTKKNQGKETATQ